jgi:hypothetical protein
VVHQSLTSEGPKPSPAFTARQSRIGAKQKSETSSTAEYTSQDATTFVGREFIKLDFTSYAFYLLLALRDGLVAGIYEVSGIHSRGQFVQVFSLDLVNPLQKLSQVLATVNIPSFQLRALRLDRSHTGGRVSNISFNREMGGNLLPLVKRGNKNTMLAIWGRNQESGSGSHRYVSQSQVSRLSHTVS